MPPRDDAPHAEVRLAEVHLALAGRPVEQWVPLRLARVELGRQLAPPPLHVPQHGRVRPLEAPLPDEPAADPLGRAALPAPAAPVLGKQRVDQARIGREGGDSGTLPTSGGLSEKSASLRRFLTVGSETPVSRAIEAPLAPLLPSLLISSISSALTISFPGPPLSKPMQRQR